MVLEVLVVLRHQGSPVSRYRLSVRRARRRPGVQIGQVGRGVRFLRLRPRYLVVLVHLGLLSGLADPTCLFHLRYPWALVLLQDLYFLVDLLVRLVR